MIVPGIPVIAFHTTPETEASGAASLRNGIGRVDEATLLSPTALTVSVAK
jgi:hypothetical protein